MAIEQHSGMTVCLVLLVVLKSAMMLLLDNLFVSIREIITTTI